MGLGIMTMRSDCFVLALMGLLLASGAQPAHGQSAQPVKAAQPPREVPVAAYSLTELPAPEPFRVHDLITIEVTERTVHVANARANRRRQASYELEFADLVVLLSGLRLRADQSIRQEQPGIDVESLENVQVNAQSNRVDDLTFTIEAQVQEIKPNGNLVIEAHSEVQVNNENLTYKLSGLVDPENINPQTRVIDSERIASKKIFVHQTGPTRDTMRRGLFMRFVDMFRFL
ncbi:Flagellar L-ring protein precursor [Planctomycetes bacterium Pan216]|uniref:Flagellar L-ring protein n=1 Tax=Kolteria novifilia TaxID=2527975 RepID=A0A518AXT4_9BACT|nr:Flagellar L-ring protein precursor [Planctomycetes bacterium Pan216]